VPVLELTVNMACAGKRDDSLDKKIDGPCFPRIRSPTPMLLPAAPGADTLEQRQAASLSRHLVLQPASIPERASNREPEPAPRGDARRCCGRPRRLSALSALRVMFASRSNPRTDSLCPPPRISTDDDSHPLRERHHLGRIDCHPTVAATNARSTRSQRAGGASCAPPAGQYLYAGR